MPSKLKDRTKQVAIEAPLNFWSEIERHAETNGYHNVSEFFNVSIHHMLGNEKIDEITHEQGASIAKEALAILLNELEYEMKNKVDMSEIRTVFRLTVNALKAKNISEDEMASIGKMVERYRLNLPVIDTKGFIFTNDLLLDEILSEDS
jgi:hypothetical protein